MKEFTIDQVSWHTDRPRDFEFDDTIIYKYFKSLIYYLQQNKLTTRVILADGEEPIKETRIHSTDLTEEGMNFIKAVVYAKWMDKVVDGKIPPDNYKILDKALNKLRNSKQEK